MNLYCSRFTCLRFLSLLAATCTCLPGIAHAEILHWWRFEEGAFLEDSAGGAPLIDRPDLLEMAVQVALPSGDRGQNFPIRFTDGNLNRFATDYLGNPLINGMRANPTTTVTEDFTIEMFHRNDNFDAGASDRVPLAIQAVFGDVSWQFLIDTAAASGPELALRIAGPAQISSGITLHEDIDYYLAASFDLNGRQATFYVQDLSNGTPLQSTTVAHPFNVLPPQPSFFIGSLAANNVNQVTDGIIDEVRFSNHVLSVDELLINNVAPTLGGDFDTDGDADGNDYLTWQLGGMPNPLSSEELALWQTNFGTVINPVGAASTTVPEPVSGAMLIFWMAAMLTGKRSMFLNFTTPDSF